MDSSFCLNIFWTLISIRVLSDTVNLDWPYNAKSELSLAAYISKIFFGSNMSCNNTLMTRGPLNLAFQRGPLVFCKYLGSKEIRKS